MKNNLKLRNSAFFLLFISLVTYISSFLIKINHLYFPYLKGLFILQMISSVLFFFIIGYGVILKLFPE